MASYPSTIASYTNPGGGSALISPDHALMHTSENNEIVAIETTLGTNAGTGVIGAFTAGDLAVRHRGGTFQTVMFGTVNLTGQGTNSGTQANGVYGTAQITGGTSTNQTINAPTIGTQNATGGTIASAAFNGGTAGTITLNVFNGWIQANETWTMLGTAAQVGTITVAAVAGKYDTGQKVAFVQGGTQMYAVISGTISGTSFTITGGADYTFGTTAITIPQYSQAAQPQGFPAFFNYTETWQGFSGAPSGGAVFFSVNGRQVTYYVERSTVGTSNANLTAVSLPITSTSSTINVDFAGIRVVDNGSVQSAPGMASIAGASQGTVSFYLTAAAGAPTSSGGKNYRGVIIYPI